eukprot:7303075-Prymnesium_polylepis.1
MVPSKRTAHDAASSRSLLAAFSHAVNAARKHATSGESTRSITLTAWRHSPTLAHRLMAALAAYTSMESTALTSDSARCQSPPHAWISLTRSREAASSLAASSTMSAPASTRAKAPGPREGRGVAELPARRERRVLKRCNRPCTIRSGVRSCGGTRRASSSGSDKSISSPRAGTKSTTRPCGARARAARVSTAAVRSAAGRGSCALETAPPTNTGAVGRKQHGGVSQQTHGNVASCICARARCGYRASPCARCGTGNASRSKSAAEPANALAFWSTPTKRVAPSAAALRSSPHDPHVGSSTRESLVMRAMLAIRKAISGSMAVGAAWRRFFSAYFPSQPV